MSRKQEILLPTTQADHFIEVSLSWHDGWNGGAKGYRLSIGPVTIKEHNGYKSKGFMLFSGYNKTIETAARFNARRLADLFADVKNSPEYAEMLSKTLAEGGYTLQ